MSYKNLQTFRFHPQNKVGKRGEALFTSFYGPAHSKLKEYDFEFQGQKIELKSDTYKSENYFMEYFSDKDKKTLGGPFRAAQDNIYWFVYLFLQEETFYWFKTEELVLFMREFMKDANPIPVRNPKFISLGYKVPRDMLKRVCFKVDKIKDLF